MGEATSELVRRLHRLESPELALRGVAALRERLSALEAVHVRNARDVGLSWGRIARALGISRQALHKKHAKRLRPRVIALPRTDGPTMIVTGAARRAVRHAREEALALGHYPVGTGHLLLGLLWPGTSAPARALRSLGLAPETTRDEVDRLVTGTPGPSEDSARADSPELLPVSRAARRALEQSLHEAVRRGDRHLGVEHLLLALLRDETGVAVKALTALGSGAAELEQALESEQARAGTSD